MSISEEYVTKFQDLYKEKYGEELTRQEAYDAALNLVNFIEVLAKIDFRDKQRKEKLKEFPNGFHIMGEGTYNCTVCGDHVSDEKTWYDKWGLKCLACQKAIDEHIIPGEICENKDLWYKTWELDSDFKLKYPTVKKLVRQGVLKARIISKTNFHVFLISENSDTLPPKEVVKYVSIRIDDKSTSLMPWYTAKDPEETLKGYKIWPHLKAFRNPDKLLEN